MIQTLANDEARFGLTHDVQNRGLRILQALITAAECEGNTIVPVRTRDLGYGPPRYESSDHFIVDTGACRVGVRMIQENDRKTHEPTARELAEKQRYSWTRIPEYDYIPSKRLRVELDARYNGRQSKWADRQRWRLEDKLPGVLVEIRLRHVEAEERRLKAESAAAEQERRRDEVLHRAKALFRESSMAEALMRQANDWQQAIMLRRYVDAMEALAGGMEAGERNRAQQWIAWCRAYIDAIDPLGRRIETPEVPEPTSDDLRPFLARGSSPRSRDNQ